MRRLSQLSHPNIVQYIGLAYRNTVCPILLTELLPISLSDYLDQSNKQDAIIPSHTKKSILLDVAVGLQYLHSKIVIHGDLTVTNVLLKKEKKAKICDFGMPKVFDPEKLNMRLTGCPGNVIYMPPEAHTDIVTKSKGLLWIDLMFSLLEFQSSTSLQRKFQNHIIFMMKTKT